MTIKDLEAKISAVMPINGGEWYMQKVGRCWLLYDVDGYFVDDFRSRKKLFEFICMFKEARNMDRFTVTEDEVKAYELCRLEYEDIN